MGQTGEHEDDADLASLEARYLSSDQPRIPTSEEARAFAKEDAVDSMGIARARRADVGAYPAVCIADPHRPRSAFQNRLAQADDDRWPEEIFDIYLRAFLLDLAAGNVALIQRPRETYEAPDYFVVDLETWEPEFDGFQLGTLLVGSDPYSEWRARSHRRRLRLWWKGRR